MILLKDLAFVNQTPCPSLPRHHILDAAKGLSYSTDYLTYIVLRLMLSDKMNLSNTAMECLNVYH